jgi:hypothetical protein
MLSLKHRAFPRRGFLNSLKNQDLRSEEAIKALVIDGIYAPQDKLVFDERNESLSRARHRLGTGPQSIYLWSFMLSGYGIYAFYA